MNDIKIGIIGSKGKMGQEIFEVLQEKNLQCIIENGEIGENKLPLFQKSNVVIDFSSVDGLNDCLDCIKTTKTPLVSGSTPMNNELMNRIKEISKISKICWSANMSIGITLLKKYSKELGKILSANDYDCEILEKHHNKKKDAPSGTAIMLGKSVANGRNIDFDKNASFDRNNVRKQEQIGFASIRGGSIFGEHEVMFIGKSEMISLKHIAYDRKLFAIGAVNCALKLIQKKDNGLYLPEDLLF